jgi:DNA-binding GntR family transcriptional regulator
MRDEATKAVTAIGQVLQEQLDHGLLAAGSKLPAERKLSELFGTTRITVREALLQLEAQGQIYREERRGWFVSPQGRVPSTEVISARLQPASAAVCAWLQLPALSSVIQICRSRRIDGRLVLYVEHYLNPQFFPGILGFDLNQSMTELYARHYDLHYGRVRFEIVPTSLSVDAAAALRVSVGSPGLRIARVNYDQHERLIDCDLEFWRHDAIHVSVDVV